MDTNVCILKAIQRNRRLPANRSKSEIYRELAHCILRGDFRNRETAKFWFRLSSRFLRKTERAVLRLGFSNLSDAELIALVCNECSLERIRLAVERSKFSPVLCEFWWNAVVCKTEQSLVNGGKEGQINALKNLVLSQVQETRKH